MPTVLFLAHGFPPAGGSGPNRALAFARYLPMYGWRPVVLTVDERWALNCDPRLLAEVPRWLEVVRTPSFERRPATSRGPPSPPTTPDYRRHRHTGVTRDAEKRYMERHTGATASQFPPPRSLERHTRSFEARLDAHARALKAGLAWQLRAVEAGLKHHVGHARRFPDAHVGWLPLALPAGLRLARRADVVYSSSGPFTNHLVGLVLHRLLERPWVVELRDGWYRWNRAIFPDYPVWRGPLERRLEAAAIRGATRVVLVTDHMAEAFRRQYPKLPPGHFAVVPNGFDPLQLAHEHPEPPRRADGFEVLHAGALYYGRPLGPFLAAAARLVDEDPAFGKAFRLNLVGTLDATARAELEASPIRERVVVRSELGHAETLAAERAADVLLLVANTTPGAEATVPGKLFEYLAVRRPVLAVAPRGSASAEVVQRTGGGWLAIVEDPHDIRRQLRTAFEAHRAGTVPRADPTELARFDRRRQAGELAGVLAAARRAGG